MTVRPLALVLAGVAFLGLNQQASAQSCSGNPCSVTNTASVTVGTLLKLTLSSTTTGLTTPDTVAFNQGYQDDLGWRAVYGADHVGCDLGHIGERHHRDHDGGLVPDAVELHPGHAR